MKLQILSDLHLSHSITRAYEQNSGIEPGGFFESITPDEDVDALILAGDIIPIEYLHMQWLHSTPLWENLAVWLSRYKNVYWLAGNHEYYHSRMNESLNSIESIDRVANRLLPNNVTFIGDSNYSFVHENTRFIFSTLWSEGSSNPTEEFAISRGINDFCLIPDFSYNVMLDKFERNVRWLRNVLSSCSDSDENAFVVTHHAPSKMSIAPRFRSSLINGAFCSDLDDLILDFPFITNWIHGHTHDHSNYYVGSCNVIANPAGYYDGFSGKFENELFDPSFIITV